MHLQGITPRTHVDGFIAELIKHSEPIITQSDITVEVIGYCYEICITCDGTNPCYSSKSRATFVVTQFLPHSKREGIVIGDEQLPVIILGHDEQLGSIKVVESLKPGQQCALLIFSIFNSVSGDRRTLSWIMRKSEARVLN